MLSTWETTSLSIQTLELLLRLALHPAFWFHYYSQNIRD